MYWSPLGVAVGVGFGVAAVVAASRDVAVAAERRGRRGRRGLLLLLILLLLLLLEVV